LQREKYFFAEQSNVQLTLFYRKTEEV